VFTARYELSLYIKQITFRLQGVKIQAESQRWNMEHAWDRCEMHTRSRGGGGT
jgi:hypothetical protein